jgi:hypothetical protein
MEVDWAVATGADIKSKLDIWEYETNVWQASAFLVRNDVAVAINTRVVRNSEGLNTRRRVFNRP